ncbi:MAG TPA: RNA polymerase sigma factor [Opitutus sp.]|nr:RNA polymerase sigma factor [Opitutus sp.]
MSLPFSADRTRFRNLVATRLGNPAGADELLQNTLPRALREAAADATDANLARWLRHVLLRAVVDHVRSLEPAALREAAWLAASSAPADADEDIIDRCVEALIATLPPRHAVLLHLIGLDGISVAAAADLLGVSPETVTADLPGAHREFRNQLEAFFRACACTPSLN